MLIYSFKERSRSAHNESPLAHTQPRVLFRHIAHTNTSMKQFERRRAKDSASLVELPLLPSRRRCRVPEAAAATSSWHQREQGRHPRAVTVALSHWTSSWCRRIACVIIWLISSDCASLWMTSELANPPWPWYPKLVLHVAAASSSPPPSPPTTHDYFATIEDSASGSGRSSSTSGSSMMSSSAASVSHPPSITPVDVLAVGAAAPSRHERRLAPGDIVQPSLPVVPQRIERKTTLSLSQVLYRAGQRGLGGGIPGAIAGAIQVLALMWLRTVINYQCRYGTTFAQAMRTLLNDGGIARLYCGLGFALIQAPLSRFVSTAANDGVESLLANLSWTQSWGPSRTTVVASIFVGLWRMLLMRTYRNFHAYTYASALLCSS
jgi:hypothetical protein